MSNKVKSILITNDDGISDLLIPTARILAEIAERITIIVPTQNRTGCSAGISHNQRLEIQKGGYIDKNEYWTVSGLPNDGVRYAMRELCPETEVVVSGINDGWNLGFNVINSGTIGAAMEGIRFGCNGLAVSAPFGFRATNADEAWISSVKKLLEQILMIDELKKCGPE
jgi:5'/3'-nucleotidase